MVRIGINPLTWTNDDLPELGEANSLETCLKEAKLAGYEGVELGRKFPRDAARARADPQGAQLESRVGLVQRAAARALGRGRDQGDAGARRRCSRALGAKVMVFCEVSRCVHGDRKIPLSKRPKLAEKEWKQFCERLDAVAAELDKQGLKMAYHHHMGTVIQSEDEVDRMMDSTKIGRPAARQRASHLCRRRSDARAQAPREAHRARALQGHPQGQARRRAQAGHELSRCGARRCVRRAGGWIDRFRSVARRAGEGTTINGWLVVEADQDPAKAHPLTHARIGHDCLRPLAQRYWTK